MADIYLSSVDGSDASDGLTWANAKATLAAALTAAGAGGRVFVDDAHAEAGAGAISLVSPGTPASPVQILCVDRTGDPEPPTALATTGVVQSNGDISFSGFAFCHGVQFVNNQNTANPNINFATTNPWWWRLDSCLLKFNFGTGTNGGILIGTAGSASGNSAKDELLELVNTPVHFNHPNQSLDVRSRFRWTNTPSALPNAVPLVLLDVAAGNGRGPVELAGVDLSAMGSGDAIVGVGAQSTLAVFLQNCKLGASVAITSGSVAGQGGVSVTLVNCDSADTNYRYFKSCYQGEIFHESTIVRTGGASDGTTGISRKLVSSANSKLYSPLVLDGIVFWNETVGSAQTVTIEVVSDNVTFTDKELWAEVEHLGTSGFPISSFADDRAADDAAHLGSGANQASSTVDWTTTGLTTPVKQKLEVTFTAQEKGPVRVRVMLAKPSTTVYVCPKPAVA